MADGAPQPVANGVRGGEAAAPAPIPSVSSDGAPAEKKASKGKRTTLSVNEKSLVKTFCEHKIAESKARGDVVPSQDVLRQEILSKFGWEVGRSTLSKIMNLEWQQLQANGETNPNMKRKRKPLFPAFEADLVKSIRAHMLRQEANPYAATSLATSVDDIEGHVVDGRVGGRQILTEAIILEEAQRLKQQHGIKDEELVLSVGWLARFKHRNGIRLRKASANRAGASDESRTPAFMDIGMTNPLTNPHKRLRDGTMDPYASTMRWQPGIPFAPGFDAYYSASAGLVHGNEFSITAAFEALTQTSLACAARAHPRPDPDSSIKEKLDKIPAEVSSLCCSHCTPLVPQGIDGLRVAVIGFNCIRDAFLASAMVGAHGAVVCFESNPSAILIASPLIDEFSTKTLGYVAPNLQIIRGSTAAPQELFSFFSTRDLVIVNCAFHTAVHRAQLLEIAINLLRDGGECRLTFVGSSRRVIPRAIDTSEVSSPSARVDALAASLYVEDFRRMCQRLGFLAPRRIFDEPLLMAACAPELHPVSASILTCRLFKLKLLEDRPEDYGEHATFNGGIPETPSCTSTSYHLDSDFSFEQGVRTRVDGNTAQILQRSWLQRYFSVEGDRTTHLGLFPSLV
ncbi:hypothetical protein Poli38472_011266 [Pythium oligandrum]|uniref:HTH CENPB-type domain-containing protein n=1 Tax=Pythium oligandrum TaxID=41045 RepID=A0A8K1CS37_PYTOL|nr:hypothetical protein Poli38472_011266 [Pythium oligandrum]|eukprot:TMW67646.1 hypothetical protein Poli38472_011266 [Pythium oligandrum]